MPAVAGKSRPRCRKTKGSRDYCPACASPLPSPLPRAVRRLRTLVGRPVEILFLCPSCFPPRYRQYSEVGLEAQFTRKTLRPWSLCPSLEFSHNSVGGWRLVGCMDQRSRGEIDGGPWALATRRFSARTSTAARARCGPSSSCALRPFLPERSQWYVPLIPEEGFDDHTDALSKLRPIAVSQSPHRNAGS
jgi:hypothetical protein